MRKTCTTCGIKKEQSEFLGKKNKCRDCNKLYMREYYLKNKESWSEYTRSWVRTNPDKKKEAALRHYHKNRDKYLVQAKEYRQANPEKVRQSSKRWEQTNRDKVVAKVQRRNALKKNRSPSWATKFFIDEIYHLAKIRSEVTGIKWHVDHMVPLNHPLVSGLHCEANLQVITQQANLSKGNKYWPDMWTQNAD